VWWVLAGVCGLVAVAVVAFLLRVVVFPPDWVERHPNGRVRARGQHYRGDRQEHWTFWHEESWKECEGEYTQGFETGTWTFYHPNGKPRARGELAGWCRQGAWEFWDDAGRPLGEVEFLTCYPSTSGGRFPARAGEPAAGTTASAEPLSSPTDCSENPSG